MDIEKLRTLNSHIEIKHMNSEAFKKYGKIIVEYDFSEIINYMEERTEIPRDGNVYVASVADMESLNIKKDIEEFFYGEMAIQIGYCNGMNSTLNGLEYHKSSEINVAVTDIILLLGSIQDISENKYESSKVEAFYIPRGASVEIYGTTLHFAPCKLSEEGFKCVVILPKGTNLEISKEGKKTKEGELLFMKNKWLIVHPSRKVLVDKGGYVGILGENIEIKISL
jgi:hypothetical protein